MTRRQPDGLLFFSCRNAEMLGYASNMIHDGHLSLAQVDLDQPRGLLTVPFLYDAFTKKHPGLTYLAVLRVFCVERFDIDNTAQVDSQALMDVKLESAADGHILVLHTWGGEIRVLVTDVDCEVEVFDHQGPAPTAHRGPFGIQSSGSPDLANVQWLR